VDNPNLKYTGDLTLEVNLKDGRLGRYQGSKLDDSELQVDEEVIFARPSLPAFSSPLGGRSGMPASRFTFTAIGFSLIADR